MSTSAVFLGLFGPFLVWPVELFLPYPHIVEELFKLLVVYLVIKERPEFWEGARSVVLLGILFALTETVLYSLKINAYGDINLLFTRLLTTSLLHSLTFLVIYIFGRRKLGMVIGLAIAVAIHLAYNKYIPTY